MVGDILFNINTAVLIVIGGFGYLAAFDIWSHRKVRRFVDLKLHTKIMLVGTAILILLGTIIFFRCGMVKSKNLWVITDLE